MTTDDRSTSAPVKPAAVMPPGRHRRSYGAYVLAWGALAALAAFYLAALTLRPELVSEHLPVFRSGEPEGNQGQRAMSKALAEVQNLRQSVSGMQLELAKLKTEVSAAQEADKATVSRIAQLETRIAAAQPALADAAAKAAPTIRTDAARPETRPETRLETGSIAKPAAEPPPAAPALAKADAVAKSDAAAVVQPKLINAPKPAVPVAVAQAAGAVATAAKAAPVTTSDAETAQLTSFGAPTVTPATAPEPAGPIGLKISNGSSLDAIRLSWSLLADRHPAQLGNMEARYAARVPEGDGDPTFDLIAGPVKSAAEAKRICKALTAKKIPCQISGFNGPTL